MLKETSRSLATNKQGSTLGVVAALAALTIVGAASRTFASEFVHHDTAENGYIVRFVLPPVSPQANPPRSFAQIEPVDERRAGGSNEGQDRESALFSPQEGHAKSTASRSGLLPIRFDLSAGSGDTDHRASETVVKKTVRVHSRTIGAIDVMVADAAVLFVERAAITRLLADDPAIGGVLASARGDRLSLADLRDLGLTVRYDPLADAIDIDPES